MYGNVGIIFSDKYLIFSFTVRKKRQAEKLVRNTGKGRDIKAAVEVGVSEKCSYPDGEQKD